MVGGRRVGAAEMRRKAHCDSARSRWKRFIMRGLLEMKTACEGRNGRQGGHCYVQIGDFAKGSRKDDLLPQVSKHIVACIAAKGRLCGITQLSDTYVSLRMKGSTEGSRSVSSA